MQLKDFDFKVWNKIKKQFKKKGVGIWKSGNDTNHFITQVDFRKGVRMKTNLHKLEKKAHLLSFVVVVLLMVFFGAVYYFTHFYFNVYMALFDLPFVLLIILACVSFSLAYVSVFTLIKENLAMKE